MAAHADDLRHWYAEHIGDAVELAASTTATPVGNVVLDPGHYEIRVRAIAGAATLWVRQQQEGQEAQLATTAAPSAPVPLGAGTRAAQGEGVLRTIVRPGTAGLSVITDAGTCTVTVIKISRGRA